MWSGEKLKPPTKDTHTLRLNLKSPEHRQRYPPDEDLDAIHVISSEYEVANPAPAKDELANYTQIYNTTHDPRFLPKLKYGAVSKSYLKKLSSIFTQHPPTQTIFLDSKGAAASTAGVATGATCINNTSTTVELFPPPDEDDEGHCSLSDKSSVKNDETGTTVCDNKVVGAIVTAMGGVTHKCTTHHVTSKPINVKNHVNKSNVIINVNANNENDKSNKNNGNRISDNSGDDAGAHECKRGLSGAITQFSLPRIALKQQG